MDTIHTILQPEEHDGLPNKICLKCYTCINDAYQFKIQCQKSDDMLRTFLKKHIETVKIVKLETAYNSEKNSEIDDADDEEYMEDNPDPEYEPEVGEEEEIHVEEMIVDSSSDLLTESSNTTSEIAYKCSQCDEYFTSMKDFSSHNFIHHNQAELPILCPQCGKRCQNDEILAVHLRHCEMHECKVCNKIFKSIGFLQNHMKKHDPTYNPDPDGKKYKCSECGKSYTSPANLQIHQYSHSGVKPFKCEFCSKGFTKMTSLNTHLSVHTGLKSHVCEECGKGFTSSSILNQHKKIHSGKVTYTYMFIENIFKSKLYNCTKYLRYLRYLV